MKIWDTLKSNVTLLVIGFGLLIAAFALGKCSGISSERIRQDKARNAANEKALETKAKADEAATIRRDEDNQNLANAAKERTDASEANPTNPSRGLNCERVRDAYGDQAAIAAGC